MSDIKTPNIDKVENVFHAVNSGHCSISVQPFSDSESGHLWSVSFPLNDEFFHGQGDTLGEAISAVRVTGKIRPCVIDVQVVEQVAS